MRPQTPPEVPQSTNSRPVGRDLRVAALGVLVVGVAAIDDGVASREQAFEAGDGVVDRIAGGDHDPDGAGGGEIFDEVFERVDAEGAGGGELGGGILAEVEADDLVTGEAEALRHVEAHFAETDDSEFHCRILLSGCEVDVGFVCIRLR